MLYGINDCCELKSKPILETKTKNWASLCVCGGPQFVDLLSTSRSKDIIGGVKSDGEDWLCLTTQNEERLFD